MGTTACARCGGSGATAIQLGFRSMKVTIRLCDEDRTALRSDVCTWTRWLPGSSCALCLKQTSAAPELIEFGSEQRYARPCDRCVTSMDNQVYRWIRLADVEAASKAERLRVVRDHKAVVSPVSNKPSHEERKRAEEAAEVARLDELWDWTSHALERLNERGRRYGFTKDDVLLTLARGKRVADTSGKLEVALGIDLGIGDVWRWIGPKCTVVARRDTQEIVTVWATQELERKGA